jgi:ribulose-phosphate 3-epimerase
MVEICPTILSNDLSDFRKKYAELFALSHHLKTLHVDFIDGRFLPNKTLMPADLGFLANSPFILVAHFMTLSPQNYFIDAKDFGFRQVIIHLEAFKRDSEIEETIAQAKRLDLKIGLAINPETPLHWIGKFLSKIDSVQLMSVHPGAQGRSFETSTLEKIKELRALSKSVIISVDGGIKVGIARQCAKAGADILVAGSSILKSENEEEALEALQADVEN